MSIAMNRFRAAAALALLLAAACDSTGPDPDEGVLVFTYSGAESGTYEARGERGGGFGWRSYAAGGVFTNWMVVEAWDGGAVADLFHFAGGTTLPGTYAFGHPSTSFYGELALDVDRRTGTPRRRFSLVHGTLVVEEVTAERIRGRFEGTAFDPVDPAVFVDITDGRFDVPNDLPPPTID